MDIQHAAVRNNIVADVLARVEIVKVSIVYEALVRAQSTDLKCSSSCRVSLSLGWNSRKYRAQPSTSIATLPQEEIGHSSRQTSKVRIHIIYVRAWTGTFGSTPHRQEHDEAVLLGQHLSRL